MGRKAASCQKVIGESSLSFESGQLVTFECNIGEFMEFLEWTVCAESVSNVNNAWTFNTGLENSMRSSDDDIISAILVLWILLKCFLVLTQCLNFPKHKI